MHNKIIKALWGDLRGDELKKFLLLATGMMLLIGSYWPLRTLKDSVFLNVVGHTFLPYAKMASLIFFFPLIIFYSRLLDIYSREKMIYVLVALFTGGGIISAYFVAHSTIGVTHDVPSGYRLFGWFFYLYVESYASLIISLYWSYINDMTTPESATKGYGMITFASQFGGLCAILAGAYYAQDTTAYAQTAPMTILFCMGLLVCIVVVVQMLNRHVHQRELSGYHLELAQAKPKKETVGFVAGITTIYESPYVAGILGLILSSDIFDAIMSYQFHTLVKTTYVVGGAVNKYLFNYGVIIQVIACLIGLLGTSFFQRVFGIRACLMIYPLLLAGASAAYFLSPTLWIITSLMVLAKSLSYAFNQPTKEILYIPTSKVVRYKSKAWMDMFGKRLGKGAGSVYNIVFGSLPPVVAVTTFSVACAWGVLAKRTGSAFMKVTKEGKIIS